MQNFERPASTHLPSNRTFLALIIGVAAGILIAGENIVITLANASVYRTASNLGANKLPLSIATTITGLTCLTFIISLLIYFIAGFVTGRLAVERKLGFVAGFLAGAISYAISFLKQYIPNFPGNTSIPGGGNAGLITGGIIISLIFLLLTGAIGGLLALLGARIATRRHPYYVGYSEYME